MPGVRDGVSKLEFVEKRDDRKERSTTSLTRNEGIEKSRGGCESFNGKRNFLIKEDNILLLY